MARSNNQTEQPIKMNKTATIFPIGGGKGGVGKSFIAANLGVLFAKQGNKVLIIDLDLGGSNLHTFLGLDYPKIELSNFLNKNENDLNQTSCNTSIPNLNVICSKNCSLESANLFHAQKLKVIKAIRKLPYDYILLDLGAGTSFDTLDFFLTSNDCIFVCTPEPTSIENTFRFIKTVFHRKLKQFFKQPALRSFISSFSHVSDDWTFKLNDLIAYAKNNEPEKGKQIHEMLKAFNFMFIMNEYRLQVDHALGSKIERIYNRHFHSNFQFLGNIHYDERVYNSVYSKTIFMQKYPYTPTATDLQYIADKITKKNNTTLQYNRVCHDKI